MMTPACVAAAAVSVGDSEALLSGELAIRLEVDDGPGLASVRPKREIDHAFHERLVVQHQVDRSLPAQVA